MAASQSRSRKSCDGPTAEEKIVASLIELMEAGSAPWRRPWDGSGGGHPVNLLSGHRYRGANPILLTLGMHIRGSGLPFWCGFAEARKPGIFPRKGSKAVHILRPQLHSREESGVGGEVTLRSWASYRPVAVFNAASATAPLTDAQLLIQAVLRASDELALSRSALARVLGRDRSLFARGKGIDPASKTGELALLVVRLYRSLAVLVGNDRELMRHWFHTANHHTGAMRA